MFDVVVVGSVNLDLVATAPRIPNPGETVGGSAYHEFAGGKGLNQAVAAARAGASVAFVAAIGDDAPGRQLRDVVRGEGIDDTWLITVADQPTGRALIVVDDQGENSIVVVPGANGQAQWPDVGAPTGRVVLAQLEVPLAVLDSAFAAGRTAGAITILNPAPAQPLPDELLQRCSYIIPNEHEVELLGGSGQLIATPGVDAVVVTLGERGAEVVTLTPGGDGNGTPHRQRVESFGVTTIDTTGAGDSFCGNLAARLSQGASLGEAAVWACAAGALATTVRGAVPSLPQRADVEALLASR